ncbi:MAG TPA: helix-turn-helix domain-containing protein, partial [Nitrospirota bacterium]
RNVLERAVILQQGCELRPSELLTKMVGPGTNSRNDVINCPADGGKFDTLEEVENKYIRLVLDRCSGNRMKTAETLGISLATLKRRLKESMNGVDKEL